MNFPVSPAVAGVPRPPIAEVLAWLAELPPPARPLLDLCQAVPDYPPAPELTAHLKDLLDDPRASQAFWLAMAVLCGAGDEVVLQSPAYFDHPMGLQAMGVRPVFAPFDPASGGLPDPAVLASLITSRTRALLLVTPSNPTGAVLPPELAAELLELARRNGIALVLDETYNAFVEGSPHLLFADPSWSDHLVHLASFGKTFALTGFRAGALIASEAFLRQALKVQDTMAVCQPRITQQAIRFGCEHLDGWVGGKRELMDRRQARFRALLQAPGHPFKLVAAGGFFAWVRHPFRGRTGRQAARLLLERGGLLTLPGEAFGPDLENFLRLALGNLPEAAMPEATARLREFSS